ncbi:Ion-translocating oxidoreductase complex subunit [Dirofilaria immitis]
MRQKSVTLPSSAVASPQISSQSSFSTSEQGNIWEHGLGIRVPKEMDTCDTEQKKYWKYRNIYRIPVPRGIEQWEDEDRKRWELINIGGLSESEADRQIKTTKARFITIQKKRDSRAPLRKDIFFIISLICFGLQITIALVCIGFCMFQIIDGSQIQAGIVFLLLALIPLFGVAGGILSALMQSESLGLCTAIYNVASAVGIIVATINVYSFKVHQSYTLSAFIPVAGIVAFVQVFGKEESNCSKISLPISDSDIRFLENEAIQREGGSSKANMIVEQQMTNPTESREVNYEMHQDNSDSQRHSALPIIHGKVKQ